VAGEVRTRTGPLATAAVAAAGLLVVALVDPNEPGHYPVCPFRALTGLDCPGCGGLRAVHALLQGDVVRAADHNVLLLLVAPFLVLAWVRWARDPGRQGAATTPAVTAPRSPLVTTAVWAVPVAVIAFWVARNLPTFAWLGSAAG
jgi:hypothetical protein